MIYFMALIPATALTIAGYFALYLSGRSEGAFRTFGKYLGFWAFTLAGLVVLGAIFAAASCGRGGGMHGMQGMRGGMHCPLADEPQYFRHPDIGTAFGPQGPQPAPAPASSAAAPAR